MMWLGVDYCPSFTDCLGASFTAGNASGWRIQRFRSHPPARQKHMVWGYLPGGRRACKDSGRPRFKDVRKSLRAAVSARACGGTNSTRQIRVFANRVLRARIAEGVVGKVPLSGLSATSLELRELNPLARGWPTRDTGPALPQPPHSGRMTAAAVPPPRGRGGQQQAHAAAVALAGGGQRARAEHRPPVVGLADVVAHEAVLGYAGGVHVALLKGVDVREELACLAVDAQFAAGVDRGALEHRLRVPERELQRVAPRAMPVLRPLAREAPRGVERARRRHQAHWRTGVPTLACVRVRSARAFCAAASSGSAEHSSG
eukprot:gene6800-biopygen5972